jgi:hypothetical protein
VDIGAHHACVIAALAGLFMIESVLPTTSTVAIRTITEAVFIATSAIAGPQSLPTVNARDRSKSDMPLCHAPRRIAAKIAMLRGLFNATLESG